MEAIAKMIQTFVILLVIGLLLALLGLPIAIAVHHHAGAALILDIVVGEVIALGIIAFAFLAMFAEGMSR